MDVVAGEYVVFTESGSVYWVDLDRMRLSRMPATRVPEPKHLRCDGTLVDLLAVDDCTTGRRMRLLIDGKVTRRTTTPVVRILSTTEVEETLAGAAL